MTLAAGLGRGRHISDVEIHVPVLAAPAPSGLLMDVSGFQGKSVLIRTRRQLPAVLAILSLDGIARRILLCPHDVGDGQISRIMQEGEVDAVLAEEDVNRLMSAPAMEGRSIVSGGEDAIDTEWILFTSGTSGFPKLVQHSLASLVAPMADGLSGGGQVWSTFYDIRRYGGLQILLRALTSGGSIVLSDPDEPIAAFLHRLGREKVTHISGTPSHWRRAIMSGSANDFSPSYVRLSGEISDQAILDRLARTYLQAKVAHAFASTEAGVVFGVDDGYAGFPESVLAGGMGRPEVRILDGTLRIRSDCTAVRYLGSGMRTIRDEDGFVDTGDLVEYRNGRYYFAGRREGVVNIGGQKVYPEEVEAVINKHPKVLMSRVWGRHSPITGTLIAADVVLSGRIGDSESEFHEIRAEIIEKCKTELGPHKVPVRLNEVRNISVMASGKIERRNA